MKFNFNEFSKSIEKHAKTENEIELNTTATIFQILWEQSEDILNIDFDSFTLEDCYRALQIHEENVIYRELDDFDEEMICLHVHPFYSISLLAEVTEDLKYVQSVPVKSRFKFI